MRVKSLLSASLVAVSLAAGGSAFADPVTLDFEPFGGNSLDDFQPIGDFYSSLGVTFSENALAAVDSPKGSGDFENNPSGDTVMAFREGQGVTLSSVPGFIGGISWYYSSAVDITVLVLDENGDELAMQSFGAQHTNPNCDVNKGTYCNWDLKNLSFVGRAYSVVFSGKASTAPQSQAAFDSITLGADPGCTVNCNPVPEPTSLALVGAGLLGLATSRRRKA